MTKPDVTAIIRGKFAETDTLTVRQIRNLKEQYGEAIDNANLVRKGFKTLIAEGICTLEGEKRGCKYVKTK
jgi:hypothetical protein